ncbi:hypothetical protein EST38_g3065 [Candolleomyces aberdarensis]|uniref:Sugar phosphate phosphatase n=1 Tax=Candolleomyces aberdarensis TaxID=2316362 RepID=A0A4Q2DV40_9AGAR|nr:hypothetical protein EST38_g3065 [Candolleomyces aberdarensis]
MAFKAPYPPYDPTDKAGYDTVIKRWPIIITNIIDELHNACHFLVLESQKLEGDAASPEKKVLEEKVAEGNGIVSKISKLKYEMARDRALEPIPDDGGSNREVFNKELEELASDRRNTWFTAPWLYAEYRLLWSYFAVTQHWNKYDPFRLSKVKTFKHSGASILKIATILHELEKSKDELVSDPSRLGVIFTEMVQMCLWGNATDLSLLTHLTEEDIRNLQTVEKDAQEARSKFILKDDQHAVWEHVKTLKDARVDFVLDNSGFELFTDLVFADFLVTYTPHVSSVVFHPKIIPWFVSDVLPQDFSETLQLLSEAPTFLLDFVSSSSSSETPSSGTGGIPPDAFAHLKATADRWQDYVSKGIFKLSVPLDTPLGGGGDKGKEASFWTTPHPYWNLAGLDPSLAEDLKKSGLVIFKGDLNYRKLTGDIKWPSWTPFQEALGPLAGEFPLLSLRTNKADVAVGVPKDVIEKLDAAGEKWRIDGRYALISFLPASSKAE